MRSSSPHTYKHISAFTGGARATEQEGSRSPGKITRKILGQRDFLNFPTLDNWLSEQVQAHANRYDEVAPCAIGFIFSRYKDALSRVYRIEKMMRYFPTHMQFHPVSSFSSLASNSEKPYTHLRRNNNRTSARSKSGSRCNQHTHIDYCMRDLHLQPQMLIRLEQSISICISIDLLVFQGNTNDDTDIKSHRRALVIAGKKRSHASGNL